MESAALSQKSHDIKSDQQPHQQLNIKIGQPPMNVNPLSSMMSLLTGTSSGGTNGGQNLIPSLIPPMVPMMPGGKPSVMSLMPNFEDPVEQSLASLEQPSTKMEIDNLNHMDLMSDMSSFMKTTQQSLMQQLGYDNMHTSAHDDNNGFNLEASLGLNGLGNLGTGINVPTGGPLGMMSMQSMSQSNVASTLNSVFDSINRNVVGLSSSGQPGTPSSNSLTPTSVSATVSNNTTPAGSFRPKPIEELLMPSHEKKTPPPAMDVKPTGGFQPVAPTGSNLAHAFKDPNLKNALASSWSSLASSSANSPQNTPTQSKSKPPAMDSFQQFRNKAKEKMDRQKLLEQQELRRTNKEAAEKQARQQQEQQKMKREEVDATAR